MSAFLDVVESVTQTRTTAEWLRRFDAADAPVAPIQSIDEHWADAQVLHNRIYSIKESAFGRIRTLRYPALLNGEVIDRSATPDEPS